jgi:5-methylcytosine-specific restriction protein B
MRKFYSCSVGEKNKGYDEDNLKRIMSNQAFILHENTPQKGYYEDIKRNDILLLKYRGQFIAYGEASDIIKSDDEEWNLFAPVNKWLFHSTLNPASGPGIYGMKKATLAGSQYGTVKPLDEEFSLGKLSNIDDQTDLYKILKSEFKIQKEIVAMQDKIDLLEYKKQIILQGPPGTGKTRMAKMIAEEMTKASKLENPIEMLDNHFKTYKPDESRLVLREKINDLIYAFQDKFKKDELKNLPLEDYALGIEDKDGFCYWLEYILNETSKYNGQADKGKIYWKSDEQKYVKSGFLKSIDDDNEAMEKMANLLDDIVNERHEQGVKYPIGKGFVLKVLNTYYPEKYFPINNEKCLTNALKLLGDDPAGLNYIQKNVRLQKLFLEKKSQYKTDITNTEFMFKLFTYDLNGMIKFEKSELIVEGKYKIVQFHPSYSYEDFVRGISAKTTDKGIYYSVEDRMLIQLAEEARKNPKGKYVLIIDEINRANLPSVLGELIYALEYRYKYSEENYKEASVESLYDKAKDGEEPDRILLLPENLYIIGTMNTSDRSVGHLDYAIRRRFAFVNILPDIEPIRTAGVGKFKSVCELFIDDFDNVDWKSPKFKPSKHIINGFQPEDIMLGHSYFITKEKDEEGNLLDEVQQIELKLQYEIIPILKEYIKDGILRDSKEMKQMINDL